MKYYGLVILFFCLIERNSSVTLISDQQLGGGGVSGRLDEWCSLECTSMILLPLDQRIMRITQVFLKWHDVNILYLKIKKC